MREGVGSTLRRPFFPGYRDSSAVEIAGNQFPNRLRDLFESYLGWVSGENLCQQLPHLGRCSIPNEELLCSGWHLTWTGPESGSRMEPGHQRATRRPNRSALITPENSQQSASFECRSSAVGALKPVGPSIRTGILRCDRVDRIERISYLISNPVKLMRLD